jgi:hypothetical protein
MAPAQGCVKQNSSGPKDNLLCCLTFCLDIDQEDVCKESAIRGLLRLV